MRPAVFDALSAAKVLKLFTVVIYSLAPVSNVLL
jgi:hypothetical protein